MFEVCNSNCYSHTCAWHNHAWPDNVTSHASVLYVLNKEIMHKEQNNRRQEDGRKRKTRSSAGFFPHWGLIS